MTNCYQRNELKFDPTCVHGSKVVVPYFYSSRLDCNKNEVKFKHIKKHNNTLEALLKSKYDKFYTIGNPLNFEKQSVYRVTPRGE